MQGIDKVGSRCLKWSLLSEATRNFLVRYIKAEVETNASNTEHLQSTPLGASPPLSYGSLPKEPDMHHVLNKKSPNCNTITYLSTKELHFLMKAGAAFAFFQKNLGPVRVHFRLGYLNSCLPKFRFPHPQLSVYLSYSSLEILKVLC